MLGCLPVLACVHHMMQTSLRPPCHVGTQAPPAGVRRRSWQSCARAVAQNAAPMHPDLHVSKEERLRAWVQKALEPTPMPAMLVPQPGADGGHSMVTLQSVEKGQVLVQVPLCLMITAATAQSDPEYGPLVTEGPLTEWQALVLALLCERARGEGSFWAPFLDLLPDQADHPLAWGEERMAWLAGSPMQATLRTRQQQVRDDCEILQMLGANDLPLASKCKGGELVSVASVTWAAATLLSRAFSLDLTDQHDADEDEDEQDESPSGPLSLAGAPSQQSDTLCVVPWADSLNHSSEAGSESCLRFSPELKAASLRAHRPYSPGQQVYDSYGPSLAPVDLLLDYGWVDTTNTNHKVDVDPTAIAPPLSKQAKTLLAAMALIGGGSDATSPQGPVLLPVTADGPDVTLLTWVRAALSSDADLIRAGWRVKARPDDIELACRVLGRLAAPSSPATEARVLTALKAHLTTRLAAYPDMTLHQGTDRAQAATHSALEAVQCALASERAALLGALEVVEDCLVRLEGGCPLDELYDSWGGDEYEDEGEDEAGEVQGNRY